MDVRASLRHAGPGVLVSVLVAAAAIYLSSDFYRGSIVASLGWSGALGDAVGAAVLLALAYAAQQGVVALRGSRQAAVDGAAPVVDELRSLPRYNEVLRRQLDVVVAETETAALEIAGRLQTIDGVVNDLNGFVEATTAGSSELFTRTATRIEESRQLISTLDDYTKARAAAGQLERQNVEQMVKGARSLGGLVQLIRSISMQTKLLAINAAIEAAHAGAVGRGFAAVAAEVHKLSTATDTAVAQLNEGIQDVAQAIESHFREKTAHDHVEAEQTALRGFAAQLDGLGRSCQEMTEHEREVLTRIRTSSAQLSEMFMAALGSVQFQDVTRQQIEHVVHALGRLDDQSGLWADCLERNPDGAPVFRPLADQLEQMFDRYVMASQRESHETAVGGSQAARPAPALAAIELF